MMRQLAVDDLPEGALDAATAFMASHLQTVRAMLAEADCTALTIILSPAAYDHCAWRQALARDLAREAAPARINVVAGVPGAALKATLRFLSDAQGLTGQYLVCHE